MSSKTGSTLTYSVHTFRSAGLEARWSRTRGGRPIIAARKPGARAFYVIDASMLATMETAGVLEGFEQHTALGDYFSIPA